MRRLAYIATMAAVFMLCACGPKGTPEDKRLHDTYIGYYEACQEIEIDFGEHDCKATIHSTDAVGHFNDEISGTYTIDGDKIDITWTEVASGNDVYTGLPLSLADSIVIDDSTDGLLLYRSAKDYTTQLSAYTPTAREIISKVLFSLMFIIILLIPVIILAAFIFAIYILFIKPRIRQRKQKQ